MEAYLYRNRTELRVNTVTKQATRAVHADILSLAGIRINAD